MDRGKFEDQWADAFKQAEVGPSSDAWINIELELERAEGKKMRRRLFFYKTLAAASVVFALMAGGVSVYLTQQNNFNKSLNSALTYNHNLNGTTLQNELTGEDIEESFKVDSNVEISGKANLNELDASNGVVKDRKENANNATYEFGSKGEEKIDMASETLKSLYANDNSGVEKKGRNEAIKTSFSFLANEGNSTIKSFSSENSDHLYLALNKDRLPALYERPDITLTLPKKEEQDAVAVMMAKLAAREQEIREEKKEKASSEDEKLWTSVGVSAGSFNTIASNVASSSSSAFAASNAVMADNEVKASGVAYAVGVNMGTRLTPRWVLQGGVNYLTQSSDYTANAVVGSPDYQTFRPASINELEQLSTDASARIKSEKLVTTAPYNVNNSVRYISLPMQAGYTLINKKFGLQLNAGISTDLFIQNVKTAEGQSLSNVDQGRDDAPYRPMNFSGLMGTELSYRFSQRYRITLNPGVRYPFQSIYKSDLGVESTPITFDVGLRFKYIFH
ncbi:outer membrane beta-barrel protein [Chryseosolibacter indicus]|uniref:Outer membrane beta-barrel protein n=1 Tax=Chryseosolibacter indicus TaxID=2782351 RepID=A0ABS5VQY5_9BACT|nr:outer membrane beta-barrel protein [Chryseosolibacter indicus]MBT1703418.1 outer membrane beta-barrel protein [Chryseosolibacter indicus]